jgi:predicted transcriptional regulator YdeE
METRIIENDILIAYVNAKSFPNGVLDAFQRLHVHFPFSADRNCYGLSRPENGQGIIYKAAAEIKNHDEAGKAGLDTMVIPKGTYVAKTVHNFHADIPIIGKTFEQLLNHSNLDPEGYCVEWYLPNDKDVMCMVRLVD